MPGGLPRLYAHLKPESHEFCFYRPQHSVNTISPGCLTGEDRSSNRRDGAFRPARFMPATRVENSGLA
jgi:hypothetical protein